MDRFDELGNGSAFRIASDPSGEVYEKGVFPGTPQKDFNSRSLWTGKIWNCFLATKVVFVP